jgi:hypothetical protein
MTDVLAMKPVGHPSKLPSESLVKEIMRYVYLPSSEGWKTQMSLE